MSGGFKEINKEALIEIINHVYSVLKTGEKVSYKWKRKDLERLIVKLKNTYFKDIPYTKLLEL